MVVSVTASIRVAVDISNDFFVVVSVVFVVVVVEVTIVGL